MTRAALALLLATGLGCRADWEPLESDSDTDPVLQELVCDDDLDACDGSCVDVWTDPDNCGGCGITCSVVQGEAACEDGICVLATCDDGWADCDGDPANGCESQNVCEDGALCETTCGSEGVTECGEDCEATCLPPEESCNLMDDDCDGACDEDALPGCRVSVHRSSGSLGHMYGNDAPELEGLGQRIEALDYFWLMAASAQGARPLFRCRKPNNKRFLTTSTDCEIGVAPETTLGFISERQICGSTALYRLYSGTAGNHFYTTSATERDRAVSEYGYRYESVAGYVWKAP